MTGQILVRVRTLTYREKLLSPNISFNSPRPAFRIGDFDAAFEKELWNFTPLADFASVEGARASLEPLLRDVETEWDILEQLRLSFEFEPGSCVLEHHLEDGTVKFESVTLAVKQLSLGATYYVARPAPSPPSGLRYTPLAGRLRAWWHEIYDQKVRLLVNANLVLTSLESEFGAPHKGAKGRKVAAQKLNVEFDVLSNLGRLCDKNDPDEGRKSKIKNEPLTPEEKTWVHETVGKLVRRAIEIDSAIVGLHFIRMKDLPPL